MTNETDFTENEIKRMFSAFSEGKENSLRWNTILSHFCDLPYGRQKTALKKIDPSRLVGLREVVNEVYESETRELLELERMKKQEVEKIKKEMEKNGITFNDLTSSLLNYAVQTEPKTNSKSGTIVCGDYEVKSPLGVNLTDKNKSILMVLLKRCDDEMICTVTSTDIAEELGENNVWAGNGLIKLKAAGFIHRLGRNRIKVYAKKITDI